MNVASRHSRRHAVRPATLVALSIFTATLLAGCAGWLEGPGAHAGKLARDAGMHQELLSAGQFQLTAFVRIARPDRPLTIYIEGDGLAWISRTEPSRDPTPQRAIGLQLALADDGPNVAYLARPCQFTPMTLNAICGPAWWTGKRFSETVVASMDAAVDTLAARVPGQRIDLVGYSGGGAIAVLVAAQRTDIASLRTVAGNLDSEAVNRLHGVSSMPESLNPIDVAPRIGALPQWHLAGSADKIIPQHIARGFVAAQCATITPCAARVVVVPGLAHDGDWAAIWRAQGHGRLTPSPQPE